MTDRLDESAKICQSCRHWAGKRYQKAGECHRFPPATYYSSQTGKAVFRWPESPKQGWCAEWEKSRSTIAPRPEQNAPAKVEA